MRLAAGSEIDAAVNLMIDPGGGEGGGEGGERVGEEIGPKDRLDSTIKS